MILKEKCDAGEEGASWKVGEEEDTAIASEEEENGWDEEKAEEEVISYHI